MTLREWLNEKGPGAMTRLARDSGVSEQTLRAVARGLRMNRFDKANAVSIATGGLVTLDDLCGDPAARKKRKR